MEELMSWNALQKTFFFFFFSLNKMGFNVSPGISAKLREQPGAPQSAAVPWAGAAHQAFSADLSCFYWRGQSGSSGSAAGLSAAGELRANTGRAPPELCTDSPRS